MGRGKRKEQWYELGRSTKVRMPTVEVPIIGFIDEYLQNKAEQDDQMTLSHVTFIFLLKHQ